MGNNFWPASSCKILRVEEVVSYPLAQCSDLIAGRGQIGDIDWISSIESVTATRVILAPNQITQRPANVLVSTHMNYQLWSVMYGNIEGFLWNYVAYRVKCTYSTSQ